MGLEVVEHSSPAYPARTQHNAGVSDLTVTFAVDFSTAGERLTKRMAGHKYLAIPLSTEPLQAARLLYKEVKSRNVRILNIAGNGLYSLSLHGWTQARLNAHLHTIISKVHEHWPLEKVVSGGQTGVDLAGVIAAHALGIDATATLPKGFLQRHLDNKDRTHAAGDVRKQILDGAAVLISS